QALLSVLADVRLAVGDFEPMKAKACELASRLGEQQHPGDVTELDEAKAFLAWLVDDHFTFLGYEEFTVLDQAEGGLIDYDPTSLLGLSKRLRSGLGADELCIEQNAVGYLREPLLLSFA